MSPHLQTNRCLSVFVSSFQHSWCFFIGEHRTLGDLLRDFVPELFSSVSGVVDNEWRVVIQGIEPPPETPVHWISEHFSHPDNFLYIVIVRAV